jgi:hypothetical protein
VGLPGIRDGRLHVLQHLLHALDRVPRPVDAESAGGATRPLCPLTGSHRELNDYDMHPTPQAVRSVARQQTAMSIHFRMSINGAVAVWLTLVSAMAAFGVDYLGDRGLMGYIIAQLVARPLMLLISESVSDPRSFAPHRTSLQHTAHQPYDG